MFKTMTLDELKTELEKRSEFRFEKMPHWSGEALYLKNTEKKTELKLYFYSNDSTSKRFISIDGNDRRGGFSGFGIPCDNIDEVIDWLNKTSVEYGWKPSNEQISY